jgi:pimeloyl-ACP methyl ester carboxylesterase
VLASEHGEDRWRTTIELGGRAWLALSDTASSPEADLYDGRFGELAMPVLIVHGAADPRTEPTELDAARRALPGATFAILEGVGHSPHSESAGAASCRRAVGEFLARTAPA